MNGQVEKQKSVGSILTMSGLPNKQLLDLDLKHSEHGALSTGHPGEQAGIFPNGLQKTVFLKGVTGVSRPSQFENGVLGASAES